MQVKKNQKFGFRFFLFGTCILMPLNNLDNWLFLKRLLISAYLREKKRKKKTTINYISLTESH